MKYDWYENKDRLRSGMIFCLSDGSKVKLDRQVPGDATKWYVADWGVSSGWSYYDSTIEPGDLCGFPHLPEEEQ